RAHFPFGATVLYVEIAVFVVALAAIGASIFALLKIRTLGEATAGEARKTAEAVRESYVSQLDDRDQQISELKLQLIAERQSVSEAHARYLELTERYARLETLHREQQRANDEAQK